jgi:hypothetical protein
MRRIVAQDDFDHQLTMGKLITGRDRGERRHDRSFRLTLRGEAAGRHGGEGA